VIVFLTLIYVVLLFLAVKIGLIRLNSFWKISPVLWMVLLFFVLFVPMQWGAPAGAVRVYQSVIEIVPNVNGEVLEVPVRALVRVREGDVLFTIDPIQYQAKVEQLEAQIALSSANLERAEDLMKRGVGRQVDVDIYAAEVNSLTAQLHNARWELGETAVRAPADGKVVALSLRPGQRVTNLPVRSWMAAEVVMRMFPGRTFPATVLEIVRINAAAQMQPSGILPLAPSPADPAMPFAVVLELDDEGLDLSTIPGGAVGTAAIYTDSVAATHIIRRVMVRMEAWMNYLKP
jgi:multidrug efflux pump subunit AcrA (membrane-fusion protein)